MNILNENLSIRTMNNDELYEFMEDFKLNNKISSIINPCVVTYNNGDIYKGELSLGNNNLRHGYGKIIYANGNIFATRWKNDIADAGGVYIHSDGTDIRGIWNNGILQCDKKTKIKFPNGDVYNGQTFNNMLSGIGIYYYNDGEIHEGEFINGIKTGFGTSYWPNGNIYIGYWADDTFNGYGKLITCDNIYTGLWCNGVQDMNGEILPNIQN